jgi:type I restriction enzyme S subunit
MKKGWKTAPLGELCDVLDHKRKPITKRDREAGEYPYYGATGVLDHVAGYLFDEPLVLVGEDGAKWASGENTAFAVEGKIWVNNHAHVLRPHRNTLLDNWLIYHLNHTDLTEFVSGLTVPKLNQGSLREIPVPVPPLAEQQRIVGLLDEAFEGLATAQANAEKNLQNARALFESHLQSVFTQRGPGWVEKSLGETCEMYQPKTIGTKDLVPDGPYPVFGANGVIGRYDKFNHEEPQLLVTCRGATCGSVNISEPNSWITGNAMVVRPKDHALDLHFLEFVFRGGIDISAAITGAAQPQITRTNLSPLLIRFPKSVTEQTRLAEKFEALTAETQRLARLYSRKLAALEALKNSLLHQAFTGALE